VASPADSANRFPLFPVLIAVAVGVLVAMLALGGGLFYLARSGRLASFAGGAVAHRSDEVAPLATHAMALEPMLVNLADQGGSSYLRVSLTLRVEDASAKKTAGSKEGGDKGSGEAVAPVRDTLLTVLGQQTADSLLAADGKEHLKTALKAALAEHNSDLKVSDVYFTDFLVQR
jgi:flagellar FliL protein